MYCVDVCVQVCQLLEYNAILAKLLEEESSETGPNKDRDLELIKVSNTIVYIDSYHYF